LGLKEVGKGDFTKYEAEIWVKLKDEKSGQHSLGAKLVSQRLAL
jgi:hypothetical protein